MFIVTVIDGFLFLGGYIKVSKILSKSEAAKYLSINEIDLWAANEYIVPEKGLEVKFHCSHQVPEEVAYTLEFKNKKGLGSIYPIVRNGRLDKQTLRGVRQLCNGSEEALFRVIKS